MTKEKEFELWAYDMWEEYCETRAVFHRDCLTFNQYLERNNAFLRMSFDAEQDPILID